MEETILINRELCIGCGLCVKDCPGNALKLEEGKAVYTRQCIECGHCVAICPSAAVSIPSYDMEEVEEYHKDSFTIDPEHFLHAVKFRRSVRNFKQEPVKKESVERIVDAGRYTATARNLQACTFVVVQERLAEFKELFWQQMPSILEVLQETKPEYVRPFTLFYEMWKKDPQNDTFFFNTTSLVIVASHNPLDAGLASANMENMAVAEGAGGLYRGYLQRTISTSPVLMEWLGIADKPIGCCMLMGYPAVKYERTAPRRKADVRFF